MESLDPNYDPFESLKNTIENADKEGYYMFICHPGYLDVYIYLASVSTEALFYTI
ncbi:MAG: hypothetical protein K0S80_3247 [Neobacillus sp.]|nr:hypothetical protein [Neobacillus sp.]